MNSKLDQSQRYDIYTYCVLSSDCIPKWLKAILRADHVVGLSQASIEINFGFEILLIGCHALISVNPTPIRKFQSSNPNFDCKFGMCRKNWQLESVFLFSIFQSEGCQKWCQSSWDIPFLLISFIMSELTFIFSVDFDNYSTRILKKRKHFHHTVFRLCFPSRISPPLHQRSQRRGLHARGASLRSQTSHFRRTRWRHFCLGYWKVSWHVGWAWDCGFSRRGIRSDGESEIRRRLGWGESETLYTGTLFITAHGVIVNGSFVAPFIVSHLNVSRGFYSQFSILPLSSRIL